MHIVSEEDRERVVTAITEQLIVVGALEPLALGTADERLWQDCDLASLAEHRSTEAVDPLTLSDQRRAALVAQVMEEKPLTPGARAFFERCFWLLEEGERVGTVALGGSTFGSTRLGVSSLYVLPQRRREGCGSRALGRLCAALAPHGLGLTLSTHWSWQPTLRFYLRLGLWVRMWKRELELCWSPDVPRHHIEVGDRRASLAVDTDSGRRVLLTAERDGDRLVLSEESLATARRGDPDLFFTALSTLSLALAMAGWPLLRSVTQWEGSYFSDAGPPEALAYKIITWEAWDRDHRWRVETPRIPRLLYPTWSELEAWWEEEDADTGLLWME